MGHRAAGPARRREPRHPVACDDRGRRTFFGHLSQATGCINALDVGAAPRDWVLRTLNYSPPSPLHRDVRNTTMEMLYAQFIQYKRR